MLRTGTQDSYIRNRINMPTARSHAELAQMDPKIRAQAFFSARVAEAHILDRLREVSDRYSRGEIGLGEARNTLKDFLKAEGYDPHKAGLKNLASTARLNLVMRQNAAMANAAAEWKRMHDPDAMKIFPYVRYHARKDSRSRDGHKELDGKIFHKDDPFLKTHTHRRGNSTAAAGWKRSPPKRRAENRKKFRSRLRRKMSPLTAPAASPSIPNTHSRSINCPI